MAHIWDFHVALLGGIVVGAFCAVSAAALNKTLELCAMLKLSVRSRGAVLGLMSWLGYALFITPMFTLGKPGVFHALVKLLAPIAPALHPNLLWWLLGNWQGDGFSIALATTAAFFGSVVIVAICALIAKWGTDAGLEGGFDNAPKTPALLKLSAGRHFRKEPLHRKELLWFFRDRGALVQAILIPLTIAAMQAFNLRHVVQSAGRSWNGFCGLAVISGTYFLLILGPRSLLSEGPALWIALTWPRGLEDLLKAKSRLWWHLSSVVVLAVLVAAAIRFPSAAWRIALVGVGWWFFSRSLAEKAVTLVTAPRSSGETQPIQRSRQWTAMLGTLAFGSGVLTGNWHLAIVGVVFFSLTAAAMWQNLRARLPYLFDPWSEELPSPPTLLHAMVAIAAMSEAVAVTTALLASFGGRESFNAARAVAYGVGSLLTYLIVQAFLKSRGVSPRKLWNWSQGLVASTQPVFVRLANVSYGLAAGAALGLFAIGYRHLLFNFPAVAKFLQQNQEPDPSLHVAQGFWWIALLTIGFAPIAEEYLFRGLLYRALDREWGGWQATIGSAAYFAIYHPPISWLPVGALGFCNALIFKKTRWLLPCVISHMAYNAIVVLTM
jgi:membrane protease YdiL (CAAX protease family)